MIQPSIHKRDIESSRMVVGGPLFDMRDLAQMLAHVHDAAMESAKIRRRQRSEGRPRSRPPAIDCTGSYVSLTEVRFAAHYGLNLDIGLGPKLGWTGRAPAPNHSENERRAENHEEQIAMSHNTTAAVAQTIGIDTGKNVLHLIGLDDKGTTVLREKIARGRITFRFANVPRCLIGIEARMATHYVSQVRSIMT